MLASALLVLDVVRCDETNLVLVSALLALGVVRCDETNLVLVSALLVHLIGVWLTVLVGVALMQLVVTPSWNPVFALACVLIFLPTPACLQRGLYTFLPGDAPFPGLLFLDHCRA